MGNDAARADDPDFGGADCYREADVWPGHPGADDETVHAGFFRADLDDPDVWLGAHAAGTDVNYCAADVNYCAANVRSADFGPNDYSAADLGPDHVRAGAVCPGYL